MPTSGKSNYLKNKELNRDFRGEAYTFPTSIFIGLSTTAPTAASPGTEIAASGYGRIEIDCDTSNFDASTAGEVTNLIEIAFATALAAWGTAVGWSAYDALTAGNHLWFGQISPSKLISNGDAPAIAVGQLKFKQSNATV